MLCYFMLCYVMLCYVMLCFAMLCYVMLCYVVMLCNVMLYCYVILLCFVMLCYVKGNREIYGFKICTVRENSNCRKIVQNCHLNVKRIDSILKNFKNKRK